MLENKKVKEAINKWLNGESVKPFKVNGNKLEVSDGAFMLVYGARANQSVAFKSESGEIKVFFEGLSLKSYEKENELAAELWRLVIDRYYSDNKPLKAIVDNANLYKGKNVVLCLDSRANSVYVKDMHTGEAVKLYSLKRGLE